MGRNRKKTVIFLIMTCFGLKALAQNGFFIRPIINTKAEFSSYYYNTPYNGVPYFNFKNQNIVWPFKLSPISIGVFIEKEFNEKYFSGLGVSQDGASSGYSFSYTTGAIFNNDTSYSPSSSRGSGGVLVTKIPFIVGRTFYGNDSLLIVGRHNFGVITKISFAINFMFHNKGNPYEPLTDFGFDSILIYPNKYLSYTEKMYSINTSAFLYSVGLDFQFTHRKREILTVSVSALYGRKALSKTVVDIAVDNDKFQATLMSTGSGLFLQISKGIALRWKKKTKEAF